MVVWLIGYLLSLLLIVARYAEGDKILYDRHTGLLAPAELRAQVAEELGLAMERYSADPKGLSNL
jgi:hypothetical protein